MNSKLGLASIATLFVVALLTACGGGSTPAQPAAAITAQPADQSVVSGTTANFNVVASSATGYQWQSSSDGGTTFTGVTGATTASYTTPATVLTGSGTKYRVVVTGASNSVTSLAATLTVSAAPVAPVFTTQPANVSIVAGQNAQMSVVVGGTPTPTLQWQLSTDSGVNWSNIVGATGSVYSMTAVAVANNGRQFRAVATNGSGSINSTAALLTVTAAPAGKSWGASAPITTGTAAQPQIAVAPTSGNAVAVWVQVDSTGTHLNIWANHYTVATHTWGTAAPIETGVGFSSHPQIAIDANGNAMTVWQQFDSTSTREDIWANRYIAGTGWGIAQLIETDNAGTAVSPQIAIDAKGNATAVWVQSNGTSSQIRSNRYSAVSGTWGAGITIIEGVSLGASALPQIAIDANGNAIAVWSRYDGTNTVLTNRYTAGIGWGTAQVIGGAGAGPQIAIDGNGNALATWSQSDGSSVKIWANRYTAGTGWGTAALIEWGGSNAGSQQVAFDSTGNAIAVWQQFDGTHYHIWSNRYTVNVGWGGFPAIIQTDSTGGSTADATVPRIAIDINGNALAVWAQTDGGSFANIWANRYIAGSGWGTTATNVQIQINSSVPGLNAGAGQPQIAVDANGNALAVWHQNNGAFTADSIFYNRFQ